MPASNNEIRELELEQYVLGELSEDRARQIEARVAEPEVAARIAAIRASNVEILAQHPAKRVALDVRAQAGTQPASANNRRGWLMGAAVAAAALFAVGVVPPMLEDGGPSRDGAELGTRTKGVLSPELVVLSRGVDGTRRLGAGDPVRDGDTLQVGYLAGGARHGVIGILDGSGAVSVLHPDGGTDRLDGGGEVMLPQALTLAAPDGFVRVLMVADDDGVDVEAVRKALAALVDGDDPARDELEVDGDPVVLDVLLPEGDDR